MNQQDLEKLGEEVRKQGYEEETGGSMQDLVFNPETGEFEQRRHSSTAPVSGMVVTEMTKEGFAGHE
ncbi:MAG: hypothetical protein IJH50_07400 [Kiritimatiellae bacterium]|nr:hypothetical protein [Kiritimatiellia bacterium]